MKIISFLLFFLIGFASAQKVNNVSIIEISNTEILTSSKSITKSDFIQKIGKPLKVISKNATEVELQYEVANFQFENDQLFGFKLSSGSQITLDGHTAFVGHTKMMDFIIPFTKASVDMGSILNYDNANFTVFQIENKGELVIIYEGFPKEKSVVKEIHFRKK